MKKFVILSFICILPVFMLAACQREQGVQAGNEPGNTGIYQPRPAPKGATPQNQEMNGELRHVNMAAKTISIRVDNGMEQTFKFDDNTMVMGLPATGKASNTSVRNLVGKEGSEVTVQWRDENGAKVATHIHVTQIPKRGTGHFSGE